MKVVSQDRFLLNLICSNGLLLIIKINQENIQIPNKSKKIKSKLQVFYSFTKSMKILKKIKMIHLDCQIPMVFC